MQCALSQDAVDAKGGTTLGRHGRHGCRGRHRAYRCQEQPTLFALHVRNTSRRTQRRRLVQEIWAHIRARNARRRCETTYVSSHGVHGTQSFCGRSTSWRRTFCVGRMPSKKRSPRAAAPHNCQNVSGACQCAASPCAHGRRECVPEPLQEVPFSIPLPLRDIDWRLQAAHVAVAVPPSDLDHGEDALARRDRVHNRSAHSHAITMRRNQASIDRTRKS